MTVPSTGERIFVYCRFVSAIFRAACGLSHLCLGYFLLGFRGLGIGFGGVQIASGNEVLGKEVFISLEGSPGIKSGNGRLSP